MKGSSANNPTSTKCFSGFLRSLLCTGSLPTHPSDQLNIELNTTQIDCRNPEKSSESEANHGKQATASLKPGVVARLMGLESLPASPLPSRQKTLGSYFRSRSVNSIDFLSQFDPVKQACHRRHRRVRTSVSFREVPSSLFVLDDKFSVVFPLDEVDETGACEEDQLQLVARKSSVIYEKRKMEKRARGKSRNGENFEERTVNKKLPAGRKMETREGSRSAVCAKSQKKDFNGKTSVNLREKRAVINKPAMDSRPTMKQVKKKKVHGVKKIHPEPTGRASHEICSNKHYSSAQRLTKNGEIRAISKSKTEKRSRNHEWTNIFEQVFKLTQESADEIDCDWTYGQISKLEDFEDICGQFGGQILEVLLTQTVQELVLLIEFST
ncbi:uncharacterized protein [Primulina huaijiensis]|uniref:uncharacterized protein isoform X2 n=1 Tax=Primulina huaijiensis TaxID=1492673 RepID=UPI003CC7091C